MMTKYKAKSLIIASLRADENLFHRVFHFAIQLAQWPLVHSPGDFLNVVAFLVKAQDSRL